jgi:hypothetical protein
MTPTKKIRAYGVRVVDPHHPGKQDFMLVISRASGKTPSYILREIRIFVLMRDEYVLHISLSSLSRAGQCETGIRTPTVTGGDA